MHNSKTKVLIVCSPLKYIRPYFSEERLISPFPKRIKEIVVEQPQALVKLHFCMAEKPKSVRLGEVNGEFHELILN